MGNPLPLLPCACSPLLLARLKHLPMPDTFMVTMDMDMLLAMPTMDTMDTLMPTTDTDMPAMDTMDTHMPTTMDITMARGPLMLSPLLMLPMDTMDMDTILDMPTMDTMDTLMPTVVTSMVRY